MQVAPAAAAAPVSVAPVSVAPATAVPGAPAAAPAAVPAVETVELNPAYQDGPADGVPVTLQPLDSAPDAPGPGKEIYYNIIIDITLEKMLREFNLIYCTIKQLQSQVYDIALYAHVYPL